MRVRGREEIEGSLQAFKDVYEAQFGKPFEADKAIDVIKQMLERKEIEVIQQRFFDFHPKELQEIIQILNWLKTPIETPPTETKVEPKPKKVKK
jgi:hypothetical protein